MSYTNSPQRLVSIFVALCLIVLGTSLPGAFAQSTTPAVSGPESGTAIDYRLSIPVRELPVFATDSANMSRRPRVNPLAGEPDGGLRGTWNRSSVPRDPLIGPAAGGRTPALDFSFEGIRQSHRLRQLLAARYQW